MPIQTIKFKDTIYPAFQADGNAARWIMPFAQEICKGTGYDIGCGRKEWAFPGAICIDEAFEGEYNAHNLPAMQVDYIFSSHCLEHVDDWVAALDIWTQRIRKGGVLFLYLPDYSQEYWRPWNNRKHVNILTPGIITDYLRDAGYVKIFASGVDLNNSFTVIAERA